MAQIEFEQFLIVTYQFNRNLFISSDICAYLQSQRVSLASNRIVSLLTMVDVSKGSTTEFPGQSVLSSYS